MMKKLTLLMILMATTTMYSSAQEKEDFNYYQNKYKGNTVVTSLDKTILEISINSDGELEIEEHTEERRVYLKDNAAQFSQASISYSENRKLKEIEAYSLLPVPNKNGKFKKEKVKDFSTKTEFSSGIFHNGIKSENFFYPSLSKGAVTVEKYTTIQDIPQLLSSFYLAGYYPIELREIEIRAGKGVEMDFSYVNADDPKYQPTIEEGRKGKIYRWQIRDIPGAEIEEDSPDISFYTPQIVPRVSQYNYKGETIPLLRNEGDLYNWYYSLVAKTDKEPNDALKAVVDSLIQDGDDDLEKIKKIYYWVQDNIRYVAFEEGMQGFIPDDAGQVCDKRYGDCKGLTSILYSMCKQANVEAYFAWVGTRDRPYRYAIVPTPIVDNHMILSYKYKDQFYFLDGTSNTSPITEPTSFIQGKEVMVSIDADNFKILEVPVKPYAYTYHKDTIHLTVDESGLIKGKGKIRQNGFYGSSTKSYLKLMSDEDRQDFFDSYLEKGSNKCQLDTFWISDISDREGDLIINYEFTLPDYANVADGEIYLNMSLDKIYADEKMKKDRKTPYEVRFKSMNAQVVILDVPEGYEVSYLPKNRSYKKELFGSGVEMSSENGKVIQSFNHFDNFLLLNQENFQDWNAMIKTMKSIYRESIILKKI